MTGTTILTYSASLENPAKKNISNLQIATLNIMLPEAKLRLGLFGLHRAAEQVGQPSA